MSTPDDSESLLHPEALTSIEGADLAALVWNREELLRRIHLLFETKTLAGLKAIIPQPLEVENVANYQHMEQFIRRMQNEITKLCERIGEAMKRAALDRSDVPAIVTQHIGIFQAEVRQCIEGLESKMNGKAMEAIRMAETNMTGTFSFKHLEEIAMLETMETIPPDARLSTDQFLTVKERPKAQVSIAFRDTQNNEWKKAIQKREEERAAIPPFRWSWTDDELFAKNKLPQTFRFTHSLEEIESLWEETAETLRTGFKEWQQQCRTKIDPEQVFKKKSGGTFHREDALKDMEQRFMKQVPEVGAMVVKEFSPDNPIWRASLQTVQSGVISNLETHCDIHGGTDPAFISEVLSTFYAKASEAEAVQHPFVRNEYVDRASSKYQWMFQTRYISESVTPSTSILSKVTGLGRASESSTLHANLFEKMRAESGATFTGNLKHAFHLSAKSLEEELEGALTAKLPKNHAEHSRSEHIQLWKEVIAHSFDIIARFQHADLTESQLMQLRNAASFIVAWQARDAVFRVGLMDNWENDDIDCESANSALNDFYPAPPEKKNDAVTPHVTMSDVGEWLEQVRNTALQQLDIACTNAPDAGEVRLQENVSKIVMGELQKVSLTGFPHRGKDTITSGTELVALATHLMSAISRLQKNVRVQEDFYALPEELPIFLQTQIGMMVETLCEEYGWSKEKDSDIDHKEKTDAVPRKEAVDEVPAAPTITFTPHEKLLANISPFSMRWLAKKSKAIEKLAFDIFYPLTVEELCTLLQNTLNQWCDAEVLHMKQWVSDFGSGKLHIKNDDLTRPERAHGIGLKYNHWIREASTYLRIQINALIRSLVEGLTSRHDVYETVFFDGIRNEISGLVYKFDKRNRAKWLSIPTECIDDAIDTLRKQIDNLQAEALALARIPQSERPDTKKDQKKKKRGDLSQTDSRSSNQPTQNKAKNAATPKASNTTEQSSAENIENPETHDAADDLEDTAEHETISDLFAVYDIETSQMAEAIASATADHLSHIAKRVLLEHGSQLPSEELERVTEELKTIIGHAAAQVREACGQREGLSLDREQISQAILHSFDGVLGDNTTLPMGIEEGMRALVEEATETIADADADETFIEHIMEGATSGASELDETVEMLRSALETQKIQALNQTIEKLHTASTRHMGQLSSLSEALIERAQHTTTESERASALQEAERLQTFIGTLLQMYQMKDNVAAHDDHQDSSS